MIFRCLLIFALHMLLAGEVKSDSAMSPSVIKKVRAGCVEVLVDRQLRGGGALINAGGSRPCVITAAHLFPRPNAHITIMTEGRGQYHANIIAYDFGHDLALLELDTDRKLPVLPVAGYIPSPTQPVYNFGPALKRRTLIISGDMADSRVNYTDFEPSEGYIEHIFIAAINPLLTSGGIWVNQKGEIVGVQSGRLKGDAGAPSSGLSMACTPGAISRLARNKRSTSTPGIGGWIWELWAVEQELLQRIPEGMQGLAVRWVRENGPFNRAGIKAGEVILSCNGKKISRRNEFFSIIRSKPSGTKFSLSVYSPGSKRTRTVRLATAALETRWNQYLRNLRKG